MCILVQQKASRPFINKVDWLFRNIHGVLRPAANRHHHVCDVYACDGDDDRHHPIPEEAAAGGRQNALGVWVLPSGPAAAGAAEAQRVRNAGHTNRVLQNRQERRRHHTHRSICANCGDALWVP